jgi:Pectinesterase
MKKRGPGLGTAVVMLMVATIWGTVAVAQDNLRDSAPFNGYTGVTFDTTGHSYDYLVDSSLTQDDPAAKKFKTLQAAYAAVPAGTPEKQTIIGIKPDVYLLHAEESAPASLTITKNYVTLLGLTDDRRKVVIADSRGNKEGATNNGYVVIVNATGFTAMNLTVVNYCNLDYEYPGNPAKNLKMRSSVITQAVALQAQGDKHIYSHVAFLSRLDTMFIQTTRSYFTNAYVEGTDDFLGGGQVSVFQDSEIYFPTGNGVMSASGITFINTVFKASRGLEFYKGFRNPDTLINCVLPVSTPKSPVAWVVWKAPVRQNVYSLTYHVNDAAGKPAVIADSIVGPPVFTLSRELSDAEVKAFNPWNLLRAAPNGPADDWDPANVRTKYESQGSEVFRMAVTGGSTTSQMAALGPFISPAVSPTIRTGAVGATIGVTVSPARAKETPITWSTPSNLISLSSSTGSSIVITGNNKTNRAEYVPVKAMASNGFYVTVYVYVEPAFIAPPAFTKNPVIAPPVDGKVKVNYSLDLGGREDQSLITWYQCADSQCAAPRKVAVSRGDLPLRSYTLTPGDAGKYLRVGIQPKHNISDPGAEVVATASRPIAAREIKSAVVSPNFRNFVEAENTAYENGMWTVIGTWTSSTADELVNGYGLRVSNPPGPAVPPGSGAGRAANPHSALLYQKDSPTGDMQVKVMMTPEKTAGQGFGIAGSPDDGERTQRADIFIKYDPRTKTGYSLRFWRTIQSAEKCMFQLYKIENGVGTPLNNQQELTGVFKPNTTITLTVTGSKITATGSNTVDGETLKLEGTLVPNTFGGAGVYWSGSVPVGNSNVYSQIEISHPSKTKP